MYQMLCISLEEELGLCFMTKPLFLDSGLSSYIPWLPLRSLPAEIFSRTSTVARLRSQNDLGPKWLLWCPESHASFFVQKPLYPDEVRCLVSQSIWLFATPWTVAHQAPLFMSFFRQEYWSGLPCPSPGGSSLDLSTFPFVLLSWDWLKL